ncbi:uncharacterized protein F5891DRAFT_610662 [Suillus fuscotomentosus]|uniref:Uncharacterized protein n=1 Tax=Suillus fuscotomentosus TaxID=1912939 RepID=A0AAD4E0T4_9AGAM|nr:uncharacterized protein F5891DRAFT_610662 [Suillus fuscotomentosus]KAG1896178.1 hypothetical protein F5891DRAFT_610662 [Suillus fuscotomentosus]
MLIQVVAHRSQERVSVSILVRARAMLIQVVAHRSQRRVSVSILVRARAMLIQVVAHRSQRDYLRDDHCAVIQSKLLSVASSSSSPLENIVQLISAAVIIFEHSFYIFEKRPYLQDRQNSDPSFYVALEQYMPSPHASAVREGVSVAVHTFQERSSPWKVKPLFGRFQIGKKSIRDSQKMELVNTIVKIALEHRLSRPQHQAMQHNIDGVPK